MKKIDIIYQILENIKETFDDSKFSEEYIADQIDIVRNSLIKQTLRNSGDVSEDFIQTLFEVDVTNSDDSFSSNSVNITVLKSVVIPKPLRVKLKEYFTRIGPLDMLQPSFNIVPFERLPYVGSGKYNTLQKYAAYLTERIFIGASKLIKEFILMDTICVRYIASNPDEVEVFNNGSHSNWDYEYPIPDSMINDLIRMVIDLNKPKLSLPEDKTNDATSNKVEQ